MQGTTRRRVDQPWLVVLHALAVLSLLGLALLGQFPVGYFFNDFLKDIMGFGIWSSPAPWASRKSGTIGSASVVRCATALMTNGDHDSNSALAITAAIGLFVRHACGSAAAVVASRLLWHNWEVE